MYKLLLTFRYLRRKLIPVFAMLAVVLCTAMVIVVSSIMGGFLDLIRSTGHSLMGDVSIHTGGLGGIPHYQEIVDEVGKLPEVESASPVIIAYGLLKLPRDIVKGVQVYGIQADYADTTGYDEALFWNAERLDKYPVLEHRIGSPDLVEAAVQMKTPWKQVRDDAAAVPPPIVAGIEVWPGNERTKAGEYVALWPLPGEQLTLTLLPVTQSGGLDITAETRQFLAVNEINSGYVEADAHRVFIPFDLAQQMMKMEGGSRPLRDERGEIIIDPETLLPKTGDTIPSRATEIHIKAAPGVPPQVLKARVTEIYQQVVSRHDDLMGAAYISTWEERQAGFLRAVENEKGLVTMLFSIISVVAVVMIGVVFYMIVLEKTRDIGILRAIGASPAGVSSIFLSFGAVVGTLGAGIGTLLAVLIVTYINEIHTWLGDGFGEAVFWFGITWACVLIGGAIGLFFDLRRGRRKPDTMPGIGVVLAALMTWPIMWLLMLLVRVRPRKGEIIGLAIGTVLGLIVSWSMLLAVKDLAARLNESMGFQIWDKSVYLFDKIPSTVDPVEITVIVLVAIVASIIGALIPGIRAAMVDPVESLRYE